MVDRGLSDTRTRAAALVLAGQVFSGDRRLDKAGAQVAQDIELSLKGQPHPWVSRGGIKLDSGLDHFGYDVTDRVALDVGASTGGFTDVLLSRGARRVHAVDVGYGQLAQKLRTDPRVVVMERTNARYLDRTLLPDPVDAIVCDASFIGLRTVLEAPLGLAANGAILVALIKPQFEVGRENVGKGGVVRDPELHAEVCARIRDWVSGLPGWIVDGIVPSPITGPNGNVEFLIGARFTGPTPEAPHTGAPVSPESPAD
nr:TlyA family RNA methyltransferase [Phaeovibrio sulfidiphilus]